MIERIEPLGLHHDRGAFSCGVNDIDDYLVSFNLDLAPPPHRIYVAIGDADNILGYYSLKPTIWEVKGARKQIVRSSFELELAMIGVATEHQCKGIVGIELMYDAFEKTLQVVDTIGGIERLWVGPLNDRCRNFYRRIGFSEPGNTKRMFMTVSEIADGLR